MFLHIGNNMVLPTNEIVGIFDISSLEAKSTKEFLKISREEGFVHDNGKESQKFRSFILTLQNIYFSPISSTTLRKRVKSFYARTQEDIYLEEYLKSDELEEDEAY